MGEIKNRYDFILVFDVKDGNPNGDPDAGNLPRIDPETGHGLITDVCLKRKVRNFIELSRQGESGYDIFIKEKAILNRQIETAYSEGGINLQNETTSDGAKRKEKGKAQGKEVEEGRTLMCKRFYDVRTFGAVMSTGPNAGQVRGPVQLTFARSINPVVTLEHSITRMAVTKEEDAEKQGGDNRTMGRKFTIPYGLYLGYGFISPQLAKQTGFNEDDLALFWESLTKMFDFDRSAARGLMGLRKLLVFQHESLLGNAPAHRLFDQVHIDLVQPDCSPRCFSDYRITLDKDTIPSGVSVSDFSEVPVLI